MMNKLNKVNYASLACDVVILLENKLKVSLVNLHLILIVYESWLFERSDLMAESDFFSIA
jgi:hypothetical protein